MNKNESQNVKKFRINEKITNSHKKPDINNVENAENDKTIVEQQISTKRKGNKKITISINKKPDIASKVASENEKKEMVQQSNAKNAGSISNSKKSSTKVFFTAIDEYAKGDILLNNASKNNKVIDENTIENWEKTLGDDISLEQSGFYQRKGLKRRCLMSNNGSLKLSNKTQVKQTLTEKLDIFKNITSNNIDEIHQPRSSNEKLKKENLKKKTPKTMPSHKITRKNTNESEKNKENQLSNNLSSEEKDELKSDFIFNAIDSLDKKTKNVFDESNVLDKVSTKFSNFRTKNVFEEKYGSRKKNSKAPEIFVKANESIRTSKKTQKKNVSNNFEKKKKMLNVTIF
ncbi:hypothetical protein EDEG_02137 [Edhazardia aedis USNM 41457]|uniref:Uncharacterized protein n=1 Tax=Edhazardia aedis (strain USNM 41457) TaxID=1003232 RepID=J8ZV98_EDHAE|nr:hypothetical protein EDEG_02137 [Edhazardia aedis USNM 41457]|eukprot:EJW03553.1 hypothetical protein EDEG_02137 [Edhazardia aedis USNM 41457]